jgi:hypothetical protein
MSHLAPEALWEALDTPAQAHLDSCAQCRGALESVQFARGLLAPPGEPPPLPETSARRIGSVLLRAAEERALHLTHEQLWEPLDDTALEHVTFCHPCAGELEKVQFARGVLAEPKDVPALSEQAARRIGAVLFAAAEARAQHLTQEQMWGELSGSAQEHVAFCKKCSGQLESVRFARGALVQPSAPPKLSDASARRIGDVLRDAAEKQAERRAWWPFNFSIGWALAPVAAALLAFAAYVLQQPRTVEQPVAPLAKNEPLVVPAPEPTPAPVIEAPKPVLAKKMTASVTSAKKAGALKKAQQLSEGTTVSTAKGGALWMKLPDGSRAGLTGASEVKLEQLEEKTVALNVSQGSLVVVARHDPSRVLHVRAGELDVVDVGTKFLVSKDEHRTLVAVEEGEVEVNAPGEKLPVRAGHAVEWRGGKLTQQAWAMEEPKPAVVAQAPKKHEVLDDTPPIPSEDERKVAPPAPVVAPAPAAEKEPAPEKEPEPQAVTNPDDWSKFQQAAAAETPPPTPSPEPPPAAPTQPAAMAQPQPAATPPTPQEQADDENLVQKLQRKLQRFKDGITAGIRSREDRAGDIVAWSRDERMCNEVIRNADIWLGEQVQKGETFNLRKSVMKAKLHCLEYQGRTGEAQAVRKDLERF